MDTGLAPALQAIPRVVLPLALPASRSAVFAFCHQAGTGFSPPPCLTIETHAHRVPVVIASMPRRCI